MKDPKPPDTPKKKEEKPPKRHPLVDELAELNANEKAILSRMKGLPPKKRPDWISVTVGQRVSIDGLTFKISHISKGFLLLELTSQNASGDDDEYVWNQLKCTGAKSLIRIDGTPFFVETRVLTAESEKPPEEK